MIYTYTKETSNIFGLQYIPKLFGSIDDDSDGGDWGAKEELGAYNGSSTHFTPCAESALLTGFKWADKVTSILEIGVHRPTHAADVSSTQILFREKPMDAIYLGVDIDDRSQLNSVKNNIVTIRCSSSDYLQVYTWMNYMNIKEFDFIFIDGWHSVNQVVTEWTHYASKLSVGGVIGFHDTNYHPGPRLVYDAIDSTIFDKKKFCVSSDEFGLAFAKRIK